MLRADRTAVEKTPLEIEGAFQGYAPKKAAEGNKYISLSSPSSPANSQAGSSKVDLKPNMTWAGGHGKHGALKEPRCKTEVPKALVQHVYLGGMRDLRNKAVVEQNVGTLEKVCMRGTCGGRELQHEKLPVR